MDTNRINQPVIRISLISALFLLTFSLLAPFANAYSGKGKGKDGGGFFRSLRDDHSIPEKCREVNLSHFSTYKLETFTYGPIGANNRGFTHEYPLRRDDARKLWSLAKSLVSGADRDNIERGMKKNQRLLRDFRLIADYYEHMDFNFKSEGEVLEILAILDMVQKLPEDFYVYGSVTYGDRVAGELDLMVGQKSDCQIISIGEAKLGLRSLGKAKEQLARFKGFLRTHLHNYLNPFELNQYAR